MPTLEERIEDLEYLLYTDYHLEQYMRRYYTPTEVIEFYQRAHDEYNALLRQQKCRVEYNDIYKR